MDFLKKLVRGSANYLFKFLILLLAVVGALVFTFHSPKKIEKSLRDSGVYSSFVDSALQEVQKSSQQNPSNDQIPIDDPAIKAAANKAFNPEFLQNNTEQVLNATYDWLAGKTKTPQFSIDLTSAKQTFASAVGQAAANRVAGLPVCTNAQLRQMAASGQLNDIDPFNVTCRPAGLNITQEQAKVVNDLATSKDFLGTTTLNAQNLPKDEKGQTLFDKLNQAPKIYKLVNSSPWILGILAALCATAVIWLYDSRRRGLRAVGLTLGLDGTFLIVISLISIWLIHKATSPHGALYDAAKGSFQGTATKAMNSLGTSVEQAVTWYAVVYLILGIIILAALHFTKPKQSPEETKLLGDARATGKTKTAAVKPAIPKTKVN